MSENLQYYVIETNGRIHFLTKYDENEAFKKLMESNENILEVWMDGMMLIDITYNPEKEAFQTALHRKLDFYPEKGQQMFHQIVEKLSEIYQDI
ncbi:hypothetical protein ACJ2A9_11025 [Anaerobacillus sp. MEB173]|uniref:hypothetical protein n=1 Tax=Anaerobacillus sp. MEB173 TaxID=3383345 RepID=UPI003F91C2D5